jgi:hypothetical protein
MLQVQQQIAQEYEQMKAIVSILQMFKADIQVDRPLGKKKDIGFISSFSTCIMNAANLCFS